MEQLRGPINATYNFIDSFIDACDPTSRKSECRASFDSIPEYAENTFTSIGECILGDVPACWQFPDDLQNYKTALINTVSDCKANEFKDDIIDLADTGNLFTYLIKIGMNQE
eukprot:CAMPEP_0168314764 /NCGR_PEP_ID=MMETSP0210-20121227/9412_1 /TAXON_ID=40633 /ORGANISM="Condylostoma magnum, Strain COL2" /LENGTH=111 /DNA_ID=CAMNT_0008284937 /DNA_START=109 /DNA_END=444 /DNA_ORIENTATION=+